LGGGGAPFGTAWKFCAWKFGGFEGGLYEFGPGWYEFGLGTGLPENWFIWFWISLNGFIVVVVVVECW